MVVLSKKNVIIPSADGSRSIRLSREEIADVPAWAAKTPYFKALLADGKVCAIQKRKRDDAEEPPEAPPETTPQPDGASEED